VEQCNRVRLRIAQEAARIMAEEGVSEHGLAKRKAAARLGLPSPAKRDLPRAEEIDAALVEYHRLFRADDQPLHIARLRQLALEAMRFLAEFSPYLVGGVWDGAAGRHSPICLHLFPGAPEDVMRKLLNARIPFEEKAGAIALENGRGADCPLLLFYADDVAVELSLAPPDMKGRSARRKAGGEAPGGTLKMLEKMLSAHSRPQRVGSDSSVRA
jgi:hypothetical protein